MSNHENGMGRLILQPMDPGVRLFRTWQFQLSVLIPLSLAVIFFFWISEVENLKFEMSSEAVRNLWNYHKLPLTLLGLIFPFTALVASHHRSVQAAEQIRQQQAQNTLTNHFLHTEEFIKVWHELGLPDQASLTKSLREIHSGIFPVTLKGDFSISRRFISDLEALIAIGHHLLDSIRQNPSQRHLITKLSGAWKILADFTGLKAPRLSGDPNIYPFTAASTYLQNINKNIELIAELVSFLPPNNIRRMKHDIQALETQRENICKEAIAREWRLSTLGGNLESQLEDLGSAHTENEPTLQEVERHFHELVISGEFSDDEVHHVFPWERATQRSAHLSDGMNSWIKKNDPRTHRG